MKSNNLQSYPLKKSNYTIKIVDWILLISKKLTIFLGSLILCKINFKPPSPLRLLNPSYKKNL